jgi:hypothetical protein
VEPTYSRNTKKLPSLPTKSVGQPRVQQRCDETAGLCRGGKQVDLVHGEAVETLQPDGKVV